MVTKNDALTFTWKINYHLNHLRLNNSFWQALQRHGSLQRQQKTISVAVTMQCINMPQITLLEHICACGSAEQT